MKLIFVETSGLTEVVREYFVRDEHYLRFQLALLADSERGVVMPGCGGIRKTRWPDPRRQKGSRGGLRIIYLLVPEANICLLLDVYDKDEADDLTVEERRAWAEYARAFRDSVATHQKGNR